MLVEKKRRSSADFEAAASLDMATRSVVYERLMNAVAEHRLKPGTKLTEDRLAAIFKVSRTTVREALQQMAHERVVRIYPNRGAFIASPTVDEARELFEARRHIEVPILDNVCRKAGTAEVARLRAHVAREVAARIADDRRSAVRLSGEFHALLAELSGNRFLERTLRGLLTLTCLTILLYNAPTAKACPHDEHGRLTDAIEAGDADGARRLMLEHLDHIEATLRLHGTDEEDDDLEAILADDSR